MFAYDICQNFQNFYITQQWDIFDLIRNNDIPSVKSYLDQNIHPDKICSPKNGYTLLGWMLSHPFEWFSFEKREIAKLLIGKGASLWNRIRQGYRHITLFERAFELRFHELTQLYLKNNPTYSNGYTIIDCYTLGAYDYATLLLHLGHINDRSKCEKDTFLHYAVENWEDFPAYGNVDIIDDLIFYFGGNPYLEDSEGVTPFSLIQEYALDDHQFLALAEKIHSIK